MIMLSGYLTSGGAPINYFEAVGWSLEGRAHKAGYDSFLEYWYNDLAEPFKRIRRRMNAR